MAELLTDEFTQRLYERLPQVYRTEDEQLDRPLLRYLGLIGSEGHRVEQFLGDFNRADGADRHDVPYPVEPSMAATEWEGPDLVGTLTYPIMDARVISPRNLPPGTDVGTSVFRTRMLEMFAGLDNIDQTTLMGSHTNPILTKGLGDTAYSTRMVGYEQVLTNPVEGSVSINTGEGEVYTIVGEVDSSPGQVLRGSIAVRVDSGDPENSEIAAYFVHYDDTETQIDAVSGGSHLVDDIRVHPDLDDGWLLASVADEVPAGTETTELVLLVNEDSSGSFVIEYGSQEIRRRSGDVVDCARDDEAFIVGPADLLRRHEPSFTFTESGSPGTDAWIISEDRFSQSDARIAHGPRIEITQETKPPLEDLVLWIWDFGDNTDPDFPLVEGTYALEQDVWLGPSSVGSLHVWVEYNEDGVPRQHSIKIGPRYESVDGTGWKSKKLEFDLPDTGTAITNFRVLIEFVVSPANPDPVFVPLPELRFIVPPDTSRSETETVTVLSQRIGLAGSDLSPLNDPNEVFEFSFKYQFLDHLPGDRLTATATYLDSGTPVGESEEVTVSDRGTFIMETTPGVFSTATHIKFELQASRRDLRVAISDVHLRGLGIRGADAQPESRVMTHDVVESLDLVNGDVIPLTVWTRVPDREPSHVWPLVRLSSTTDSGYEPIDVSDDPKNEWVRHDRAFVFTGSGNPRLEILQSPFRVSEYHGTGLVDVIVSHSPPVSRLANPVYAEQSWLPWLGQVLGSRSQDRNVMLRTPEQHLIGTERGLRFVFQRIIYPLINDYGADAQLSLERHYQDNPDHIRVYLHGSSILAMPTSVHDRLEEAVRSSMPAGVEVFFAYTDPPSSVQGVAYRDIDPSITWQTTDQFETWRH